MSIDTQKLQKAFLDISNHIYVNDGVLKDRVFIDIVRLISLKMIMEKSKKVNLLSLNYLNKLSPLELDSWAGELMVFARNSGIEESSNSSWNIKESSIYWAAKQMALFEFNSFPTDVKGEAFQTLVVNNLRGDRGEYFTPEPLVSAVCEIAQLSANSHVIDPACGSGGFLYGAYRAGVSATNLFGAELSNDVGGAAQARMQILGGQRNQIRIGNAIRILGDLHGTFDRVLMNPPFGSRTKFEDMETLANFDLSRIQGKSDKLSPLSPEILFLELSIRLLASGGILGTVIPDGILQNSSSRFVRDWLLEKADLIAIVSCPSVTFVPYGTGVKTSLLIMQKKKKRSRATLSYMAISRSVGYDSRGKTKFLDVFEINDQQPDKFIDYKIDEDLTKISKEVVQFCLTNEAAEFEVGNLTFVTSDNPRWDAEFYQKEDSSLLQDLDQKNSPRLGEVCDLISQKIQKKQLIGKQHYLAISDIDSRTSQIVNIQNLDVLDLPSRASYIGKKGDVVTAIAGASTGSNKHASAIIKGRHDGILISSGFALLRPTIIDANQLLGFLRSELFLRQIFRLRTGHAIPSVSHSDLMNIKVPALGNPIWSEWAKSMKELDLRAESLFNFADSIRGSLHES